VCPHGSLIALCEPWMPENWQAIAAEEGFSLALNLTGMATARLLPARRSAPPLEFRQVQDDDTARDLAGVNSQAYGMTMELWECICNTRLYPETTCAFVAYRDGIAISTAATLPVHDDLYVAFVATLPGEHGKGYAEAVMRHAIEQGQTRMGARRMILHASDAGQPLYRSMGFQAGCRVPMFAPAQSSDELS